MHADYIQSVSIHPLNHYMMISKWSMIEEACKAKKCINFCIFQNLLPQLKEKSTLEDVVYFVILAWPPAI